MGIESNKKFSAGSLPLQPASSLPLPASAKDKYGASAPVAGDETVCGEITRVVYSSPDGSYCVARFKLDSGENVTLVGPLADLGEGLNLEATGRWETHREHGRQFRVVSFCPIIATRQFTTIEFPASLYNCVLLLTCEAFS